MTSFINRRMFLVWKLRDRILRAARIQEQIISDLDTFKNEDQATKDRFKDARMWYLYLLGMSIVDLRKTMNTEDLSMTANSYSVEQVFKRVKPVPVRYLRELVACGQISQEAMDLIIAGGYSDINDFFAEVNNLEVSDDEYDDDGFFAESSEDDESDDEHQEDSGNGAEATTVAQEGCSSKFDLNLLDKDPLAPDSFDWAEDVESELELPAGIETPMFSPSTPAQPPPPSPTPATADDELASYEAISLSDISDQDSSSESEAENEKSSATSPSASPPIPNAHVELPHPQSDSGWDADIESNATEAEEAPTAMNDDEMDPETPPFQCSINKFVHTDPNSTNGWDRDMIMDKRVEEYNMPYWQWEMLYIIAYTAKKFKKEFEDARAAYKADPYRDMD
ncbi:hypothetical protein GGR52DRAFT_590697 [Hypoxylon sp. FL1284]|nr:hypothetical protein GGR52DRAFT_590697 [Hypoxylon sp. FL1284]